jgi:hypothetical protein
MSLPAARSERPASAGRLLSARDPQAAAFAGPRGRSLADQARIEATSLVDATVGAAIPAFRITDASFRRLPAYQSGRNFAP